MWEFMKMMMGYLLGRAIDEMTNYHAPNGPLGGGGGGGFNNGKNGGF